MTNQIRIPRQAAVARIKRQWPEADEVRQEVAHCTHCLHETLWSFQLPGDHLHEQGYETTNYWCNSCGRSDSGLRPSLDVDPEQAHE